MSEPTYQNDLVLASTFIKHDSISHVTEVTYAVNDGGANLSAQQWADGLQSAFATRFAGDIDNQAVILKTTTLKGDGTTTFTLGESTAAGTRGTVSASQLPPNSAVLLRKLTGLGGRKNRGRMYLPFMLHESNVDETGAISPSDVAAIQSDADDWLGDVSAGGATFVIANRVYDLPWDNPARKLTAVNIGAEVTALVVEPIVATQRRRLVR